MPNPRERWSRYSTFQARLGEAGMIFGTVALLLGLGIVLTHIPKEEDFLSFMISTRVGRVAAFTTFAGIVGLFWGNEHRMTHRGTESYNTRY